MTYYHSVKTRDLISAVAPVVCPKRPDPARVLPEILSRTELSIRAFPGPARTALLTGMRGYDEAARVFVAAKGKPARELAPDVAEAYFSSWWRSKLGVQREFAKGLKGVICLAYYETDLVKEHIGYTPEAWFEVVTARRLAVYSDEIAAQEARVTEPDPLPPWPET